MGSRQVAEQDDGGAKNGAWVSWPNIALIALGTKPADSEHWFTKMLEGGADYCTDTMLLSPKDGRFSQRKHGTRLTLP